MDNIHDERNTISMDRVHVHIDNEDDESRLRVDKFERAKRIVRS